jgi:hypothetical protein
VILCIKELSFSSPFISIWVACPSVPLPESRRNNSCLLCLSPIPRDRRPCLFIGLNCEKQEVQLRPLSQLQISNT